MVTLFLSNLSGFRVWKAEEQNHNAISRLKKNKMEQGHILKPCDSKGKTFWFEDMLPRFLTDMSKLLDLYENRDSSRAKTGIYSKQVMFTKHFYNEHCHHPYEETQQ